MDDAETRLEAADETEAEETGATQASGAPPRTPPAAPAHAAPGASPLHVIKLGQGVHVRWGTAIGGGLVALAGAAFVWDRIRVFTVIEQNDAIRTLIPVVLLVAAAYFIFWLVGRSPRTVDFMIATEGEMKKVNWSTRREVWGATRVVIVTLFALAIVLAVVDAVFILFFSWIGVLQFNVIQRFFTGENA